MIRTERERGSVLPREDVTKRHQVACRQQGVRSRRTCSRAERRCAAKPSRNRGRDSAGYQYERLLRRSAGSLRSDDNPCSCASAATRDRVGVEFLVRHLARVRHDERQVGILQHDARQIHDDRVLTRGSEDAASVRYSTLVTPETASDSASRSLRLETDVERTRISNRARPLSDLRSGSMPRLDVVVEDVVVPKRVVAVEAAACRELSDRWIKRQGQAILSTEDADVLRLLCRQRVCQRVEATRLDLGEKVANGRKQVPRRPG